MRTMKITLIIAYIFFAMSMHLLADPDLAGNQTDSDAMDAEISPQDLDPELEDVLDIINKDFGENNKYLTKCFFEGPSAITWAEMTDTSKSCKKSF